MTVATDAGPDERAPAGPSPGPEAPDQPGRRRFWVAAALGGLAALVPFAWLLGYGRADLTQSHVLSGFYDAQAHAFLDLRWDVPAEVLSVEAFTVEGRSYMYFGPMPALLRLPVAAVTDRFDGRLTQLSMLLALAVALVAAARLSWRIRSLLRGGAVGRRDLAAAAATTFLLGAGSTLLFLASGIIVYHEAILWGVALSLAAYDALLGYLGDGRPRLLVATAVLATLAVLARPSVGLGPALAVGFVLLGRAVAWWRAGGAAAVAARWRHLGALAVAAALPVSLQAATNHAKFGSLFGIPFESQLVSRIQPGRMELLERTGGTLFGVEYVPTTLLHYLRPDGIGLQRQLPWVAFPGEPTVIGDLPFDVLDRSASLPASMPWLVALAVVGLVVLVRARTPGARRARAAVWAPALGATVATASTLAIAYTANRYLADALPALVLVGLVGLHHLLALPRRRATLAGLALLPLAVAAVWVNLSLGLLFQRAFGPPAHEAVRAELVAWQHDADRLLPGDQAPPVRASAADGPLPDAGAESELVVVGDCAGLYQFDGDEWRPVERTAAVGRHVFDLELPTGPAGSRTELAAGGSGDDGRRLLLEHRGGRRAAFVVEAGGAEHLGREVVVGPGRHRVDVRLDRRLRTAEVELDGENVLWGLFYRAGSDDLEPTGPAPTPTRRVHVEPTLCRSLAAGPARAAP